MKAIFRFLFDGKRGNGRQAEEISSLRAARVDVQEIYFTLANGEESSSFTKTMKVLDHYFVPKSNVPFERHLFRQIAQASDETVDQSVCRPRQRAVSCDFGVLEDDGFSGASSALEFK